MGFLTKTTGHWYLPDISITIGEYFQTGPDLRSMKL